MNIPVTVRQYLGKGYRGGYLGYRFAIMPMDSGRWICLVEDEGFEMIRKSTPNECIRSVVHLISNQVISTGNGARVSAYERSHGIPKGEPLPADRIQMGMRLTSHSPKGIWLSIEEQGA